MQAKYLIEKIKNVCIAKLEYGMEQNLYILGDKLKRINANSPEFKLGATIQILFIFVFIKRIRKSIAERIGCLLKAILYLLPRFTVGVCQLIKFYF